MWRSSRQRDTSGFTLARQGFTLIEMVVVIAVLATLAGMLTPLAMRLLERQERQSTEQRLQAVYEAAVGRWGEGDYGFLGDIGRLPAGGSLDELVAQGALPAYTPGANGVGLGWKGPYVATLNEDYKRDGWGRPLVFDSATGQVRSLGEDGVQGTPDDIVYPAIPCPLQGSLQVSLVEEDSGAYVPVTSNAVVTVYYASGGAQAFKQSNVAPYLVPALPPGYHAVYAIDTTNNKQGWLNTQSTTGIKNVQLVLR